MAPGNKRKRGDRAFSQDSNDANGRPSTHRPQDMRLANTQQQDSPRGRRPSRGSHRGGSSAPQSPAGIQQSPTAMSPSPGFPTPSRPQPPVQLSQASPSSAIELNDHITQECLESWSTTGRAALVEAATSDQATDAHQAALFGEMVQACIDGDMSGEELGFVVQDILATPLPDSDFCASLLLEVISLHPDADTHAEALLPMLQASGIDHNKMRAELDVPMLVKLRLVRPTFPKMAIRKATTALYRQSNYNLLREESEGFAKLLTEYFTALENARPTQQEVTEIYQRVLALIGAFDVDVGRALDVTLDVFANLLVKYTKVVVKMLSISAWWPKIQVPDGIEWDEPEVCTVPGWAWPESTSWSYSEEEKEEQLSARESRDIKFWKRVAESGISAWHDLGARHVKGISPQLESLLSTPLRDNASEFEKEQWSTVERIAKTGKLPPTSNRQAAQLLGFKLQFYASDARDPTDVLPDNVIHLAALLIKIGFISLEDLEQHLYPSDEDMESHRKKLLAAKKEQEDKMRGISTNALAKAGALVDDTIVPSHASRLRDAESKSLSKSESERGTPLRADELGPKLPEPVDQKTALLRSLLHIGAIPEALHILGRFPWLMEVYPDIHGDIFRLFHQMLSKVNDASRPFIQHDPSSKQGSINPSAPREQDYAPRRTLRWARPEQRDAARGQNEGWVDYKFYWDDWSDNVPICQSVDDVLLLCNSFIQFVGAEIGKDPMLVGKLARIGKKSLSDDPSEANRARWVELSTKLLLPALSFVDHNNGAVGEVWELITLFDVQTRFTMYGTWVGKTARRQPAIDGRFKQAELETKGILARMSTENLKPMARALAAVACPCPGAVFAKAIAAVESYPNIIDVLVECTRYFTFLAYDILTYSLIEALKNPRPAMQDDGMLIRPWLRNLASFIAKLYKRYTLMKPGPMIMYLAGAIRQGNLPMLTVLEQLVASMGGITIQPTLTEQQVFGISSGPLMRAFTLEHKLGDHRHTVKVPSARLMKCLEDHEELAPLLVLLAQHVVRYVDSDATEDMPVKVIGNNLDDLYAKFTQYLDLLRSHMTVAQFDAAVPDVVTLMAEYGIDRELAFTISRVSLGAAINASRLQNDVAKPSKQAQSDGDVIMSEDTNGAQSVPNESQIQESNGSGDVEMKEAPESEDADTKVTGSPHSDASDTQATAKGRRNPQVDDLAQQLQVRLPELFGNSEFLTFQVTFWSLSLADLFNDTTASAEYSIVTTHLHDSAKTSLGGRRDASSQQRFQVLLEQSDRIRNETTDMITRSSRIRDVLKKEMLIWFDGVQMMDAPSASFHDKLLQDCFLPRIRTSPEDAQFAAAMLKFMHAAGVPGFRTMKFLDQFFQTDRLYSIIHMCTAREAQNFGRFLNELLRDLKHWHGSQEKYTKQALGDKGDSKRLPGFGRTFNEDRTPATFLDFEDFRRVLFKWHMKMFRAFEQALKNGEYILLRNAINILKAISNQYPAVDSMARELRSAVESVSQNDPRADLKLSALSLLGDFKRNEKFWVTAAAFHAARPQHGIPRADQLNTPQSLKLDASALAFKPSPTPNGVSKRTDQHEDEDGEVMDGKKPTVAPANSFPVMKTLDSPASAPSLAHLPKTQQPQPAKPSTGAAPLAPKILPNRPDGRADMPQPSAHPRAHPSLPTRPDSQPQLSRPRHSDSGQDYPPPHVRSDGRGHANAEYSRPDRPGESQHTLHPDRRDLSPGRRQRGRSQERPGPPDRREPAWPSRDTRDYHDSRSLREPPRDLRGPPTGRGANWQDHPRDRDMRDMRDMRDGRDRDRADYRAGPPPQVTDNRGRLHPNSAHPSDDHRRDFQSNIDRTGSGPPRTPLAPPSTLPPVADRNLLNPERAARMDNDRVRSDASRSDRDIRRDRDSRAQSPRRDERGPPHHSRDDRPMDRMPRDRTEPQLNPSNRERREDVMAHAPTGPREPRNDTSRAPREWTSNPPRAAYTSQDPNYGRLNHPVEGAPIAPSTTRRNPSQTPSIPPTQPSTSQPDRGNNIHPSRLNHIGPPTLQTNVAGAPSGPRSTNRTPQGPLASPTTRNMPPAMPRGPIVEIQSHLAQNGPSAATNNARERNPSQSGPPIRGRGGNRASGPIDTPIMAGQVAPSSQSNTPNTTRLDDPQLRNRLEQPRSDNHSQDDGRLDSRGHGRRSERSGRHRSRSPDRSDRRPDDRESRVAREKRDSDRESSRRERERDNDKSSRDGGRDRRERGGRGEDAGSRRGPPTSNPNTESIPWTGDSRGDVRGGRGAGGDRRDDRDRRNRDDGRDSGRDSGRKRPRAPEEQPPHGDMKRSRRSNQ